MHEQRESLGERAGATADGMVVVVGDVPASGRFEARDGDGELVGYTSYRHNGDETFLVQHRDRAGLAGRGVATAMTAAVLDLLRAAGRSAVPRCPFVRDFLARHDELWDLVARAAPAHDQTAVSARPGHNGLAEGTGG